MNLSLQNLLLNKHSFKVNALILGYWLWHIMSINQLQTMTIEVPLCFYNNQSVTINAPETVSLTIFGYKSDLLLLEPDLAVHINCQTLQKSDNYFIVTPNLLFLPERVKLIRSVPSAVLITMEEKHTSK